MNTKAVDIIKALCFMGETDFCGTISVPSGDEQTEGWWLSAMGAMPPAPIEGGEYLYQYGTCGGDVLYDGQFYINPDAKIEMPSDNYGHEIINLYKIN